MYLLPTVMKTAMQALQTIEKLIYHVFVICVYCHDKYFHDISWCLFFLVLPKGIHKLYCEILLSGNSIP